jgi:hypothetical protein
VVPSAEQAIREIEEEMGLMWGALFDTQSAPASNDT